jgi:hypothetical protein
LITPLGFLIRVKNHSTFHQKSIKSPKSQRQGAFFLSESEFSDGQNFQNENHNIPLILFCKFSNPVNSDSDNLIWFKHNTGIAVSSKTIKSPKSQWQGAFFIYARGIRECFFDG